MAEFRCLLWIILLLGFTSGSNVTSAPQNTTQLTPDGSGNGTSPLFKNSTFASGELQMNESPVSLSSLPSTGGGTSSSALVEATPYISTTVPEILPFPARHRFQHAVDSLRMVTIRTTAISSHTPSSSKPSAQSSLDRSSSFIQNSTNAAKAWLENLSFNTTTTNGTSSFVPRPMNNSDTGVRSPLLQDARNISDLGNSSSSRTGISFLQNESSSGVRPPPFQDARNISDLGNSSSKTGIATLENETSSDKILYNATNFIPMNISSSPPNATLGQGPWFNGTQYLSLKNSTAWSKNLVNSSISASKDEPSRENSDLYPPTDFSNVTFKHNCDPLDLKETSSSTNSRLPPPRSTACRERNADFFEFSEQNIRESGVFDWYARWTIEVRDKKLQQYTEHGEWRMFYRWWLQEYDFRCGYDFSACQNAKTREEVQNMYPGEENRALVRRIYFITLMYDYLHDHTKMMQDTFKNLHDDISGHISELIGTFTQHGDPHGVRLCEVYKIMIQSAVNSAIGLLGTIASGAAGPFLFMPDSGLGSKGMPTIGDPVGGNLNPGLVDGDPIGFRDGMKVNFALYQWATGAATGLAVSNWYTWQTLMEDRIAREQPVIMTGMGRGWSGLCASVEGDFQDQSTANAERLSQYLSLAFQHVRETTYDTFHDIYMGKVIPQPRNPSFMAAVMANRKWTGENSIVSELEDARSMQRLIRGSTLKTIISKLLTESQNWMKCAYDKNAPKMCEKARKARAQGKKGNVVDRSRFCPHPDTDPTYICEVGGWYFADDHQHQRKMCGLDGLESFWGNEFNFTLEQFMEEVHANYESCGNNCTEVRLEELAFDGNYGAARGFAIPVCRSEYVRLDNFLKTGPSRWHFPSICGDWRADETEGFMRAANMGPDSQAAQTPSIQQLWRDRIPREIEGVRPLTYYLTLCAHGIHFPDKWKWDTTEDKLHNVKNTFNHYQIPYHHSPSPHCAWVMSAISSMDDEMAANHFFCESPYVWDNILTQQASHIDMRVVPLRRFENLQTKCTKWMKKRGGRPPYKAMAPTRQDWLDMWMLLLDNVWRSLPVTLPVSIGEAVQMSQMGLDR